MNRKVLLALMFIGSLIHHPMLFAGKLITVPSEVPGVYKKVELKDFIEAHRYEKASDLRTISDAYRNDTKHAALSEKQTCELAAAYELAAILAGDTTLLSWANVKFGAKNIELFLKEELDLQEAIFNSLADKC